MTATILRQAQDAFQHRKHAALYCAKLRLGTPIQRGTPAQLDTPTRRGTSTETFHFFQKTFALGAG